MKGKIEAFLFSKRTKNVLIFLFFLVMSTAFWGIKTLEESTIVSLVAPLRLTNVPEEVIITTNLPRQIRVLVRDKGSELVSRMWNPVLDTLLIDFRQFKTQDATGNGRVMPDQLTQLLKDKLPAHSTILSITPDTLLFCYNRGIHRKMPVVLTGSLTASQQYHLDSYCFYPDSVDVYAPTSVLDTMKVARTEGVYLQELKKSQTLQIPLFTPRSVRIFPDTIRMEVNVDILMRKTLDVYIEGTDFPEGKELHTFPTMVTIVYLVSAAQEKTLDLSRFKVTIPYADVKDGTSTKCTPRLTGIPENIPNIYITPQEVDYVVEDVSSPETENAKSPNRPNRKQPAARQKNNLKE